MPVIMNHAVKLELRPYGNPVVICDIGDFSYHLWLNSIADDGTPVVSKDRIVYKNPVDRTGIRPKTIKLSLDRGQGKAVGEHMLLEVPKLIEGAKLAFAAKQAEEAEKHRLGLIAGRKAKHVDDLYNAMVACMMALGRGGANVVGGPGRNEWEEAHELITTIETGV